MCTLQETTDANFCKFNALKSQDITSTSKVRPEILFKSALKSIYKHLDRDYVKAPA